jgi:hypothetical protein
VFDEETILLADIDLGRSRAESMTLDVTGHYHRPELFEFRPLATGRRAAGEGN